MDDDTKYAFKDLKESIHIGHGYLSGKLDAHAKAMQEHLISDASQFTELKLKAEMLREKLEAAEKRRNEDSEKRTKAVDAVQAKKDQYKLAKMAGWFAIIAAVVTVLLTSLANNVKLQIIQDHQQKLEHR